jgi:signal transduction histidine kinase
MNEPTLARMRTGVAQDVRFADRRHRSVRRKKSWHAAVEPVEARTEPVLGQYEARLHEVRGSLAAVAAAVHALAGNDSLLSSEQRDRIGRMVTHEVERLQRLVAVPSADHAGGCVELLDVDEVVGEVVLARRMAGQEVGWEPSGHSVSARRDELVEVLNILLVNAARHAEGMPVRVDVAEDAGVIRISVTDSGPGVPRELRTTIFERGARRAESPGQGLGLAIAHDLVGELGGDLVLQDDGDRGARFVFTLPAKVLGGVA